MAASWSTESVVDLGAHLANVSLGSGDGVDGSATHVSGRPVVAHDPL